MGEGWRRFFPPDTLRALGNSAVWAGQTLDRLGEQPLHPAGPHQPLVVRLLCLPTWSPACSVRAERSGLSWRLVAGELNGAEAGFDLGELARRDDCLVVGAEAERIAELWEQLRFWSIAPVSGEDVLDGTSYVLKAAEGGRYRAVIRDDPEWGDTFVEFSDLLVQLAGLPPR
jgi:hypothetical protein